MAPLVFFFILSSGLGVLKSFSAPSDGEGQDIIFRGNLPSGKNPSSPSKPLIIVVLSLAAPTDVFARSSGAVSVTL